jgi:Flp pilus assembly protein TadG
MKHAIFSQRNHRGIQNVAARRNQRKGVAAVELAILAPFLVALFLIALDFARVFYCQTTLNQCVRNGALYGSSLCSYNQTTWVSPYNTTDPETDTSIKSCTIADGASLNPALTTSQVTVTHNNGSDGNAAVQVSVTYTFNSITQFIGFGNSFTLRASCSMRVAPKLS